MPINTSPNKNKNQCTIDGILSPVCACVFLLNACPANSKFQTLIIDIDNVEIFQ